MTHKTQRQINGHSPLKDEKKVNGLTRERERE